MPSKTMIRAGIVLALAGASLALSVEGRAQGYPQPQSGGANPICQRLEAQLVSIDRGASDPQRADQIRRYEEAANKQQSELDRTQAQARRQGCERANFFNLFGGGQSAQCGPLNSQIQQMRDNLDRIMSDLQKLQGAGANYERDGQRRAILAALGRNDCGPQYRQAAAQSRGLFDTLFGGNTMFAPGVGSGSTFRTVCVRTCDGFFFPISFATTQDHFRDDEMKCQKMCPAAEVALFSHRNPGEDMAQATSLSGRLYSEMPNAFKYRQQVDQACSCRRPGESWADAMKNVDTRAGLEQGDIVVTEERAKAMAQPRDAQGRPLRPAATGAAANVGAGTNTASNPAPDPASATTEPKKPLRSVGPQFIPAR